MLDLEVRLVEVVDERRAAGQHERVHVRAVLLEQAHGLAQRRDDGLAHVARLLDVADVAHAAAQRERVLARHLLLEALDRVVDEGRELRDGVGHVLLQVRHEALRPLLRERLQRVLDGLRVDAQPADVRRRLHDVDSLGHLGVLGHDGVELGQVGHARLLGHVVRVGQVGLEGELLLGLGQVDVGRGDELGEGLVHGRRVEVGEGLVLGAELGAGVLALGQHVVERGQQHLHLEVVGHLLHVGALAGVKALEERGRVVEGVDPRVDDVVEVARLGARGLRLALVHVGREAHALARRQREVDDDHGQVLRLLDLVRVEQVAELAQRDGDQAAQALHDDAVGEVDVGAPLRAARLGHLHDERALLEALVDGLAALGDGRVALHAHALVEALELVGRHGLGLARQQRVLGPHLHVAHDVAQVLLEREEHVEGALDRGLRLAEEAVDELALPVDLGHAALQRLVDLEQLHLEQRRLDRQHLAHHLVVHLHDEVEVADLAAEGLGLLVHLERAHGHLEAEQQEVLHLAQQADERRVEVDAQQLQRHLALLVQRLRQQRQVQLLDGGLLDVGAPLLDVARLELVELRRDGGVELDHLLRLLALQQALAQRADARHGLGDAVAQAAAPRERAALRRQVPRERRPLAVLEEHLLHALEVFREVLHERQVLAVELVRDGGALEQVVEGVEQLEARRDGRGVVEALAQHGREAPVELLDLAAEGREVAREGLGVNVEQVVGHALERGHGGLEVRVDGVERGRELLALEAADGDLLELEELRHDRGRLEHVVHALEEGVEPHEERVVLDAPRVLRAVGHGHLLVAEVDALEVAADAQQVAQAAHGGRGLLVRDELEDLLARQVLARLDDDGVAHLADHDHEARGRVVEVRVLPDEQQHVHDGPEDLGQVLEVVRVLQALEPRLERHEEARVVVGLLARGEDLLAEVREGRAVGRLARVEELQHAADALALQLVEDGVEVGRLDLPEGDLDVGRRVQALLERRLRVRLEHVLDLLRPRDDGVLEQVHAVLRGERARRGRVQRRQRQARLATRQAHRDAHGAQEGVQAVDDLLAGDLAPAVLVRGVAQQRQVDLGQHLLEVLERLRAHLVHHELGGRVADLARLLVLQEVDDLVYALGQLLRQADLRRERVAVVAQHAQVLLVQVVVEPHQRLRVLEDLDLRGGRRDGAGCGQRAGKKEGQRASASGRRRRRVRARVSGAAARGVLANLSALMTPSKLR